MESYRIEWSDLTHDEMVDSKRRTRRTGLLRFHSQARMHRM